nr:MAG TPA: hypothetical protein [Caudoviricetes sp.]
MNFPTIAPPVYPIREVIPDTAFKGKLENLTIVTRRRFTKTPMTFELTWSALPEADYAILRSFFHTVNTAVAFDWTYPTGAGGPYSGKTFKVRFEEGLNFSSNNPRRWAGTIKLQEV